MQRERKDLIKYITTLETRLNNFQKHVVQCNQKVRRIDNENFALKKKANTSSNKKMRQTIKELRGQLKKKDKSSLDIEVNELRGKNRSLEKKYKITEEDYDNLEDGNKLRKSKLQQMNKELHEQLKKKDKSTLEIEVNCLKEENRYLESKYEMKVKYYEDLEDEMESQQESHEILMTRDCGIIKELEKKIELLESKLKI